MKGKLYLIPTPIGNLKEVSPRTLETLSNCDFLACEDTRNTMKLLNIFNIKKKCFSCHEHNEFEATNKIIEEINDGKTVGYLSDAGYPCISDPGFILVKEAIKNSIEIIPISGPNAFLNALIASGIDPTHFMFYGFLNSKSSQRIKELEEIKQFPYTIIFYESPYRIDSCLKDIYSVFGDRKITIARELTKVHEQFIRTNLTDISSSSLDLKGELVIVIEGNNKEEREISEKEIIKQIQSLTKLGMSRKDIVNSISLLLNINKNYIYKIVENYKNSLD